MTLRNWADFYLKLWHGCQSPTLLVVLVLMKRRHNRDFGVIVAHSRHDFDEIMAQSQQNFGEFMARCQQKFGVIVVLSRQDFDEIVLHVFVDIIMQSRQKFSKILEIS
jgi:hypothetical protein